MNIENYFEQEKGITVDAARNVGAKYTAIDLCRFAKKYHESEVKNISSNTVLCDYIPQKGDLFEWCDELYWCIESGKYSGVVNPVGETYYQRGFIWNYGNEKPIFVRKATEQEFESLFGFL